MGDVPGTDEPGMDPDRFDAVDDDARDHGLREV
jgi:hypothetical protein